MKIKTAKENFADNHVHILLRHFDGWANFSFHHKWNEVQLLVINWYLQVASQVAEQLISGKFQDFKDMSYSA